MMDEVVSAYVHYNAYHLFSSARLQEMPERYWIHEERGESLIWLYGENLLPGVCVNLVRSDPSITNEDTARQATVCS